MVIIVVPALRADDLARPEMGSLDQLLGDGAYGWMNTRTARIAGQRREPEEAAYLTLGAGSRATAGPYARDLAADGLARLKDENGRLDHPVPVGALGDMLHAAGRRTAVIGNEDDTEPRRAARLIAIDSRGRLDVDDTGAAASRVNQTEPYGLESELSAYRAGVGCDFQVWVFGDVVRADRYAPLCVPHMAERHRRTALERLNALLISCRTSPEYATTRYILLSPSAVDSASEGDRLAPILLFGGGMRAGVLTSVSTRRTGFVANTDFLPTVAAYFGLAPPSGSIGRPITVMAVPAAARPAAWARIHDNLAGQAAKQSEFGGTPLLQVALVIGATVVLTRRIAPSLHPFVPTALALVVLCLPLAQLLLPPIAPDLIWADAILLAAVVTIVALLGASSPDAARMATLVLTLGLAAVIAVDLLTGAHLLQQAWMSYSVMEGARYYGIGNEYAGAVFAAALIGAGMLLRGKQARYWPMALALLFTFAVLMGLPSYGAKAGGCLGAAAGFAAAGLVWWRGKLRARDIVMVFAVALALLMAVLAIDLLRSAGGQTHIGRALTSGESVLNIAARKAALNAYLLLHSAWSLALLASIAGLWMVLRAPATRLRRLMVEDRTARGAATGLALGSVALFLFDDSGVVAAANALLLAWAAATVLELSAPQATEPAAESA